MRFFLLSNAFKGSFSSKEINDLFQEGLSFLCDASFHSYEMADGGDGSLSALSSYRKGIFQKTKTKGPILEKEIESEFFLSDEEAFLEERRTGGLALIGTKHFKETTSYGLGEEILSAKKSGARKIHLFLGGSASNDLGLGMLSALGMNFFDRAGKKIVPTTGSLSKIVSYDKGTLEKNIRDLSFTMIPDVFAPLLGEKRATYLFASQKGARKEELPAMEKNFRRLLALFDDERRMDSQKKGAGAAGGIGYAGYRFLNAKAVLGAEYFLSLSNIGNEAREGDVLVTGEGRIDRSSFQGKLLGTLLDLAKKKKMLFLAIGGSVSAEIERKKEKDVLFLPLSSQGKILTREEMLKALKRNRDLLFSFLTRKEGNPV